MKNSDLKSQLNIKFKINLHGKYFFADNTYDYVDKEWLLGDYYKKFRRFLKDVNLYKWRSRWDCDDISVLYRVYAQSIYALSDNADKQSLAIGEIWYVDRSSGYHAINLAFVAADTMIFIEPQNGKVKILSRNEMESVTYIRM